jgi:hypothetical protein
VEDLIAWALGHVRATGAAETVKQVAWSTVVRIPVAGGAVYAKACRGQTGYEPALVAALARHVPDRVAVPIAVAPDEGRLLLEDGGPTLRTQPGNTDPATWEAFVARYAELQQAMAPHAEELLALGVPDQRPAALPVLFDELLDEVPVDDEPRRTLVALRPTLADACARLAAAGPPPTVQHDDLHTANVLPGPRFFDWGDAAVAHPFTSLLATLRSFAHWLDLPAGDPAVTRVRDAYLEPWGLGAEGRELAALATWTGCVSRSLAWRRALAGATSDEAEPYADSVPGWLEELLMDGAPR